MVVEFDLDSNINCLRFLMASGVTTSKNHHKFIRYGVQFVERGMLTLILKLRNLPDRGVLAMHTALPAVCILHEWVVRVRLYHLFAQFLHGLATVIFAPIDARRVLHNI